MRRLILAGLMATTLASAGCRDVVGEWPERADPGRLQCLVREGGPGPGGGDQRIDSTPKKTTITLDSTVSFGKDSAKITSAARARLESVATRLKAKGAGSLAVTGYTDDLGSAAHGLTLSRQRAAAVASVLRGKLPSSDNSFTVVGKGEADPAVPNTSEANRKINRRVVVVYQAR